MDGYLRRGSISIKRKYRKTVNGDRTNREQTLSPMKLYNGKQY